MSENIARTNFTAMTKPREDRLLRFWTKVHAETGALPRSSIDSLEDVRATIIEREFPNAKICALLRGDYNNFLIWLRGVYAIYPKRALEIEHPVITEIDQ
jgi:hypothetical protein